MGFWESFKSWLTVNNNTTLPVTNPVNQNNIINNSALINNQILPQNQQLPILPPNRLHYNMNGTQYKMPPPNQYGMSSPNQYKMHLPNQYRMPSPNQHRMPAANQIVPLNQYNVSGTNTSDLSQPKLLQIPEGITNLPIKMYVVFADGQRAKSSKFWKQMIIWYTVLTSSYAHAELMFEFQNKEIVSCVIYRNETVKTEKKRYDIDKKWCIYQVDATPQQIYTIYQFCGSQVGKPFNSQGLYLNFTLPSMFAVDKKGEAYFCSEFVMYALRTGIPAFQQYEPHKITPSALFEIIKKHCIVINNIPAHMVERTNFNF